MCFAEGDAPRQRRILGSAKGELVSATTASQQWSRGCRLQRLCMASS